ncbi:DUF3105 domain-containing protein [Tersicoccus sp. Bi-70]|uniref:DUF3105 domain-containing protein n=1 Tax=Tersicoccus sp. Bi-70 TaxID=1897634 RepID=UPI0009780888|nr:DUF3105 domain-containing protein [Tersicoccus sp. Bi-70]
MAGAKNPTAGDQTYTGLSSIHLASATLGQDPGIGGNHAPTWTNCGIYTRPVNTSRALHSLEHGAVWLTYWPTLPADQIRCLTDLAVGNPDLLASANATEKDDVKGTAWCGQGAKDTANRRLAAFVTTFTRGPRAPESGAACTRGADG